jgi:hypothetical protein
MIYPNFDIIIQFDQPGIRWSHNGGETWQCSGNSWNTIDWTIRHIVNKFAIYHVLDPKLTIDEELCPVCAAFGRVGVMRFNRMTDGTETQAQVLYSPDGEPYVDDVSFYCSYRIEKCDTCGNEESDYA